MVTMFMVLDRESGEGVVFDNEGDAEYALTGDEDASNYPGNSSLAEEFRNLYGDSDRLVLVEIDVDVPEEGAPE